MSRHALEWSCSLTYDVTDMSYGQFVMAELVGCFVMSFFVHLFG